MTGKLDPEQERLMRLREKQLSTRDPHIKRRKFNQYAAERERKRDKSLSVAEVWGVIPQVWKWGLFGFILGGLGLALVPKYWISPWALPVMLVLLIVLVLLGITIGNAMDLRDAIKKQLK